MSDSTEATEALPHDPPALRVLIVADHASRLFGGEAVLAVHYYERLRRRGVPAWLLTHERVRPEFDGKGYAEHVARLFGSTPGSLSTHERTFEANEYADHVSYTRDRKIHQLMGRMGTWLPDRISSLTTGYVSRLLTQIDQRRQIRRLVKELSIDVIHQPMPVSPKEPSLLYGFGVPVVIGPLNGGMDFPPAFKSADSLFARLLLKGSRWLSHGLNVLMPGKRRAAIILVANERTRRALPAGHGRSVEHMVENGVDLQLWQSRAPLRQGAHPARYVFMGRLVDWKRADILLDAFAQACRQQPMSLLIIGDGPLLAELQQRAKALGVLASAPGTASGVHFAGWMAQADAAEQLSSQDCLVLPSIRECGGAVVLEAMAASLPVIAVDWGGPADYLDNSCGILVAPRSADYLVQEMARALVALARDPALRSRLGAAGRAKVEREFDWEKKIDAIQLVYARVVAAHAATAPGPTQGGTNPPGQ